MVAWQETRGMLGLRCSRAFIVVTLILGVCTPSQAAARGGNFTSDLSQMVGWIEDGTVDNGFCWGKGLGPPGGWRSMVGKVAGCLLDKAHVLAMQWDVSIPNITGAVDAPARFYRTVCQDLAACCASTDSRGWCLEKVAPAYSQLAKLAQVADTEDEDASDELASVFAVIARAASQLLLESKVGHSDRAGLLLATCPAADGGNTPCGPEDLDRLRRELVAARRM
mmetsp:Transcript_58984/g.95433  ORF Transcript_58984/g.95433 Transcript_58984/m.95433 type:complete len:224 (-) Transcript_58984:87-758(-)